MTIITKLNRPVPGQEENLDAAQGRSTPADGRRDTGDSRFAPGASQGRFASSPTPEDQANDESDTAETGINPTTREFGEEE